MRVLIVDDQDYIRRGLRALLSEAAEIEICGEAEDGREAIAKVHELLPDVVIMDISLPRLDGLEATRQIRRHFPRVRVVTVSQYDIPDVMKESLRAGALAHVPKVLVWTSLLQALRTLPDPSGIADPLHTSTPPDNAHGHEPKSNLGQQLREAEELFHSTLEQTAVGIGHIANDGRWLRVNQKLCSITGYTKDELVYVQFQALIHPADLPDDLLHDQRVAAGQLDHYTLEGRLLTKDRRVISAQITVDAVRDAHRNLKYCVCVIEDNSARQQLLAQARRDCEALAAHLELITSQLNLPAARCTRDLRYVWANQPYADLVQKPLDQIIGSRISDVLGNEPFESLQPHFQQVPRGQTVSYHASIPFDGNGRRSITATYAPIFSESGALDGWVSLVQVARVQDAANSAH
jgi:PAS domain S-box-containing protein